MATKHQLPASQEFIDQISTESGFIDDDLFESSYLDTFNPAGNLLLNSPTYPEAFGDGRPGISGTIQIPSDLDTSKESLPSLSGVKKANSARHRFFNPFSSTESLPSNSPAKLTSFSATDKKLINSPSDIKRNANSGTVKKDYSKPVKQFLENGSSESDTAVSNNAKNKVDNAKPVANVLPNPSKQHNVITNGGPVHSDSSNSVQTPSTRDSNSSSESLCAGKYDTIVPMKNLQIKELNCQVKPTNTVKGIPSKRQSKKPPPKPPQRTVSNNTNHLSKTPTKLEPPYAQANIPLPLGSSDSEYIGVGAKRKSFRIPAENFVEYHDPHTLSQPHNNIKPLSPALVKHRQSNHDRKSDSIEKLESNEFMLSPHNELTESTFMGSYFHDSSFNPSSSSSNRDSTVSCSSSGSGSTNASSGSRPSLKKDSLHYAATNIVSLPPPSQTKVHRTSKQDTTQALQSLRKRVQIVQDESALKLLPYTIPPDCSTRVTFPAATWDLMMQNFRIALSMDNVFICDHFLGRDSALLLHQELQMLKMSGHFERHMQNRAGNPAYMKYATVFLTEPDNALPRIDGLVLMIYKLAHYFVGDWKQISVQISYFPNGHTQDHSPKQESAQRFLKCVYFANLPADEVELAPEQQGRYFVEQNGREMCVEPTFDRLLAFWGDNMAHKIEGYPLERFIINVWMVR